MITLHIQFPWKFLQHYKPKPFFFRERNEDGDFNYRSDSFYHPPRLPPLPQRSIVPIPHFFLSLALTSFPMSSAQETEYLWVIRAGNLSCGLIVC